MSYTPNNQKPGDVLTAAKMNKLEAAVAQGGGGGGVLKLNVNASSDPPTLDASYNDIVSAFEAGKVIFAVAELPPQGICLIMYLIGYTINDEFAVQFFNPEGGGVIFSASTADELLIAQQGA